jgi:hypothetical protein
MNAKQTAAAERIRKAFVAAHKAGLQGGVYDGTFMVWPEKSKPDPRDCGLQFFDAVDEIGQKIHTLMRLDGGSGV